MFISLFSCKLKAVVVLTPRFAVGMDLGGYLVHLDGCYRTWGTSEAAGTAVSDTPLTFIVVSLVHVLILASPFYTSSTLLTLCLLF